MNESDLFFHASGIVSIFAMLRILTLSFHYNDCNSPLCVPRSRKIRLSLLGVGAVLKSAAYFMCLSGSKRWWATDALGTMIVMLAVLSVVVARSRAVTKTEQGARREAHAL